MTITTPYEDWTDDSYTEHITVRNVSGSDVEVVGRSCGLLVHGASATVPATEQVNAMIANGTLKETRRPH